MVALTQLHQQGLGSEDVASKPAVGTGVSLDDQGRLPQGVPVLTLLVVTADPSTAKVGDVWYRSDLAKISIQHNATTVKRTAALT